MISRFAKQSFNLIPKGTRTLTTSRVLFSAPSNPNAKTASKLEEVTGPDGSLIGPGAKPGTIPSDLDQATGLERFELLGKMEGIDVFDMEDPIFQGSGTMKDPYIVPTYIGYRYVGCRGKKGEEHRPYWMKVTTDAPARCWHSGVVFLAKYVGEPGHSHH